ncbi:reverse transcriptase domain-containing protein [Tanacetum coccineum]
MRTRNSNFPNNSNVTIPKRQNRGRAPNIVEPELRTIVEVAPMAERTMEVLLRAPTEGYGEAIVLPEINADHFEIKTNLLQLVQANPFHDVQNDVIKLFMFPYSLEENARLCEAWVRFKEMLPHHGFTELTQVDTFYNGLNENDQDSLNAAAGGDLWSKTTREALNIIENKSKVRYSCNKSNVSRMNTTSRESVSKTDERIDVSTASTLVSTGSKVSTVSRADDENPPPPPVVTPTQQAPHTVSTIKLPILKKDTNGQIKVLPPKTAKEILARERERKARITLLMAIPEDHLAKFHKMTDAKEMTKPGVDSLSFDDIYNNLRVFEIDVKGSTGSSSSAQNVAFVSSESTNSTNDVSTTYGATTSSRYNSQRENSSSYTNELMHSFFANQSSGPTIRINENWNRLMSLNGFEMASGHDFHKIEEVLQEDMEKVADDPQKTLKGKGIVDSGCSRHMTGNKAYLHFNLFSVSHMCDKKNKVLFTYTECLVLSSDFKLPDEKQVLLRIPRQNNMYSFNLGNIVPSEGLACLIAKATVDESNKWHRRLGHVNFKNLNKLVKGNLVRGLPSKIFQNDHTCVACQKGKQHKASCKAKIVSSISQPLKLLHMGLFGPTSHGEPFNDVYITPAHTLKVFSNMSQKGVKFSGKVTPHFDSILEPYQEPEGEDSRDSLEGTNGSEGDQIQPSHDSNILGGPTSNRAKGGMTLEELSVLCTNLSNKVLALEASKDVQAVEIIKLKARIKKLEKKSQPVISHHKAWLRSVSRLSMKRKLGRKEFVSKQRRKNTKPGPTLDDSTFNNLDADHVLEKGGSNEEPVSVAGNTGVSAAGNKKLVLLLQ